MCVLTYVPVGTDGFIVTSNRDENTARPKARPPQKRKIHGKELFCPLDPTSQGTWIATAKKYTMVLLNGAFLKHTPTPPYRQSRGRVILDFMKWNDPETFFSDYDFTDMEPFTLVLFNNQSRNDIVEIRWCGREKYLNRFDGEAALIWSSATLYSPEATAHRKAWFDAALAAAQAEISSKTLLDFHHNGGKEDPENSLKLKRSNGIETVCITQLEIYPTVKCLYFSDLVADDNKRYFIY